MSDDITGFILNPPPDSAISRARDYGIDLTQLARNLSLTPDQRLEKAERSRRMAVSLRKMRAEAHRS
jgi:hypothetical protein